MGRVFGFVINTIFNNRFFDRVIFSLFLFSGVQLIHLLSIAKLVFILRSFRAKSIKK